MSPGRRPWTVVLPFKGGAAAKSRLGGPPALARAFALDTLDAVLATPVAARAVVVTADAALAAEARSLGAAVVPESRPGAGLDAAVRDGLAACPEAPTAVLLGDLPALLPEDLATALTACAGTLRHASAVVVPDADGIGTVLLAAARPHDVDPAFGPASAAVHARRGAVRLDLDLPRLRRTSTPRPTSTRRWHSGRDCAPARCIHAAVAADDRLALRA